MRQAARDYLVAVARWVGLPFLGGALAVLLAHLYPSRPWLAVATGAAYALAVTLCLRRWRRRVRHDTWTVGVRLPGPPPGRKLYCWLDDRCRLRREWLTDEEAARVVPDPYRREVS